MVNGAGNEWSDGSIHPSNHPAIHPPLYFGEMDLASRSYPLLD